MRILVTSDWHLDASTAGYDRFNDVCEAIDLTVTRAIHEHVDMYLFLGDLCDPDANRAPRCVAKAIQVDSQLKGVGIRTRWLTGNHDVIEDGSGTSTLTPLKAAGAAVIDEPMTANIDGVSFIWLPFTPRCKHYDSAAFVRSAFVQSGETGLVIMAGHLSVAGIDFGSETKDMPRGRDMWLPIGDAAERWGDRVLMLNGHYHVGQSDSRPMYGGGLHIPGSLQRLTFGEEHNRPAFLIVEVPNGKA